VAWQHIVRADEEESIDIPLNGSGEYTLLVRTEDFDGDYGWTWGFGS
jgi:hypothetical protein